MGVHLSPVCVCVHLCHLLAGCAVLSMAGGDIASHCCLCCCCCVCHACVQAELNEATDTVFATFAAEAAALKEVLGLPTGTVSLSVVVLVRHRGGCSEGVPVQSLAGAAGATHGAGVPAVTANIRGC